MAKFRVGDIVVGNGLGPYSVTGKNFTGEVLAIKSDGIIYIASDSESDSDWRSDGTFQGKPYFSVREEYFDLVDAPEIVTEESVEEIDYDATPKEGDLVRFLSFDEIVAKYKNKYIDKTIKAGYGYNIRAYTNKVYYPAIEQAADDYTEFLQSKIYRRNSWFGRFAGKQGIVREVRRDGKLNIIKANPNDITDFGWTFVEEQVEVVERDYVKKKAEEEKRKRDEARKEFLEDEIIQEMISKVDTSNMKRILSASLKLNAKKITGVDDIVKEWAIAKKDLYLLLNRNLKITVEKELDLNSAEKNMKFKELMQQFPGELFLACTSTDIDFVVENQINANSNMFRFVKERNSEIKPGISLTTFMHKVFNNKELDTELSKFFESTKTKGYITVSIDPVDYMLMSMNNSDWHSCQSLCKSKVGISIGEYSAGVFSYMCDKTSLISFRHSKNETENIVINNTKIKGLNKNWRQMIYIDLEHKFFVCSREYPNKNEPTAKFVREEVEELISKRFGIDNNWKATTEKYLGDVVVNTPAPGHEFDYELHYNDMYHDFHGRMVYQTRLSDYEDFKIEIGSFPICPICGREQLKDHGFPFCNICRKENIVSHYDDEDYDDDDYYGEEEDEW